MGETIIGISIHVPLARDDSRNYLKFVRIFR